MKKETGFGPHPHEDLKPSTLLRVVQHCRNHASVKRNGEYGIIVPKKSGRGFSWDVMFPNGERVMFVPQNWELVSNG